MSARRQILIAEDETPIREGLVDALESEGYAVTAVGDGKSALMQLKQGTFHLAILDVMMPGMSGYDVCREIRKTQQQLPILMLTAKGQEIDKVVGLELGADDYMVKPFGVRELLARLSALLRRTDLSADPDASLERLPDRFKIGEAEIHARQYELAHDGKTESLTRRELKLIGVFHLKPDEVLSRDFLLDAVWGIDYMGTTRTLDQHVAQIRKKLGYSGKLIETVHGVGYRFRRSSPDPHQE